jgi:hypothetical protein
MELLASGRATGSSPSEPLRQEPVKDTLPGATPAKRRRGKSLSRRTGQDGHIEKSGRWFAVRFWKDIPGQEERTHVRERVCPISGPGLLSKSERKRRAREIIQASVVDSAERFNEVVKQDAGMTFREQSIVWLRRLQNRKRNWKSAVGERGQSFCETAHREDVIVGLETTNC